MKARINIKGIVMFAAVLLLSVWAGYAVGYHHGVRDDQREWWASIQFDTQGNHVFLGPQAKARFDPYFVRQNPIFQKPDR